MSDFVELGDLSDLPDGQMRVFPDVGEFGVMVCRVKGQLYGVVDNCSHADTPLSEGRLRGSTVTCPLHGAQFDVTTGEHLGPPAWEGVACVAITETEGVAVLDPTPRPPDDGSANDDVGGRLKSR